MESLKKIGKSVVGRIAGAAGLFRNVFESHMTVAAFHRIGDVGADSGLTCSVSQFEAFCEFFAANFHVVRFGDQVRACIAGKSMAGTLAITFDDGYGDNLELAAPILTRYGLHATFFITTGFIGTNQVAPWDLGLVPTPKWMNWRDLEQLSEMGFALESHSHRHLDLGSSSYEDVYSDICLSKELLRDRLGIVSELFAYPFGGLENINSRSLKAVKDAGFIGCASCYGGLNPPTTDPYDIRRVAFGNWFMSPYQFGFEAFAGKLNR